MESAGSLTSAGGEEQPASVWVCDDCLSVYVTVSSANRCSLEILEGHTPVDCRLKGHPVHALFLGSIVWCPCSHHTNNRITTYVHFTSDFLLLKVFTSNGHSASFWPFEVLLITCFPLSAKCSPGNSALCWSAESRCPPPLRPPIARPSSDIQPSVYRKKAVARSLVSSWPLDAWFFNTLVTS